MKRSTLLLVMFVIGAALVWVLMPRNDQITVQSAVATPVGDGAVYMIGVTLENKGAAQRLISVSSPNAEMVQVMGGQGHIVIPGKGKGIFAMDGAHIILRSNGDRVDDGGFLPLTLGFADGSSVSTRSKVDTGIMMDHSPTSGAEVNPAPRLEIALVEAGLSGAKVEVTTQNFTFVNKGDTADHVDGEGHAHVYMNGLKLARLYAGEFETGALLAGDYSLRVSLNTNDHRAYVQNGAAVFRTLEFTVP